MKGQHTLTRLTGNKKMSYRRKRKLNIDKHSQKALGVVAIATAIISATVTLAGYFIGSKISQATIESSKQDIVKELILTLYDSSNPDKQKGAAIGLSIYKDTAITPLISVLRDSALFEYSVRSLYEIGENAIERLLYIIDTSGDYDQRIIACRAICEMKLISRSDIAKKFYYLLEINKSASNNNTYKSKISALNGLLLYGISITNWKETFEDYDFSNINFTSSIFKKQELIIPRINADSSNFSKSYFQFINFSNGNLKKSNFSYCSIDSGIFLKCSLQGSNFEKVKLSNCIFDNSKLQNSNLKNSMINRCNFKKSIFVNIDLQNSKIYNSDFTGATIIDIDTTNTYIDKETLSTMKVSN
ncbi:MAG: pentapeptide repeat-containing protein [Ignavibacteriales bacterium]|nr:pentapeptide repeat-containing protein [Ignavibacteriales bacterium]